MELDGGCVLLDAEMCEIWLRPGKLLSYLSALKYWKLIGILPQSLHRWEDDVEE